MMRVFVPLLHLIHLSLAVSISKCPTGESNYTTSSGSTFAICPNTDYIGDTATLLGGVKSSEACASACSQNADCTRAVYNAQTLDCHLKGKNIDWQTATTYSSMRLVDALTDGTPITKCPAPETNITTDSGAVFALCKSTDYQVASLQILDNIQSEGGCANSCAQSNACAQAVYDASNKVCHLKGNITDLNWKYNRQYSALRSVKSAPTPAVQSKGRWSQPIQFPIIPVAAYVVPADPAPARLLVFSSYGARAFSGPTGITQFADYNFNTGAVSQRTVTNTKHDMFCPGISSLADGRIVISGGENAEATSAYDPSSNNFVRLADMKIPRGYQTSVTTSQGKIFTIGGSFTGPQGNKTGELYDPKTNAWTLLPGADPTPLLTVDHEGIWRTDNHAWLYAWRDGSVFQAGPSRAMNWYYTTNGGSVKPAGTRQTVMDQMCGVNVMYDVGKILSAGGSQDYTDSPASTRADLITITDPGVPARVERVSDMQFARGFANAVVLPDGKVMVTGGQLRSLVFTDTDSVLTPELFDPATKKWTQLAPAAIPRNYHSVSILLPDATVFVGGGGMCPAAQGDDLHWCDRAKDHFDGEMFSPPYLFDDKGAPAVRPVISALSKGTTQAGDTVTVTMDTSADFTFALVRMGSATHSINSDQRRIPLTGVTRAGARFTMKLPTDSGILVPGPYYLFALSKAGVPSVARTLRVRL